MLKIYYALIEFNAAFLTAGNKLPVTGWGLLNAGSIFYTTDTTMEYPIPDIRGLTKSSALRSGSELNSVLLLSLERNRPLPLRS